MMNALRLIDGVPSAFLPERTGINAAQISRAIQTAQHKGILDGNPLYFRPTALGQRFLNDLIGLFLCTREGVDSVRIVRQPENE